MLAIILLAVAACLLIVGCSLAFGLPGGLIATSAVIGAVGVDLAGSDGDEQ